MNALRKIGLMLQLSLRARRAKISPDSSGIVGLNGRAETAIAPDGTVFVRGELWPAHSAAAIAPGEIVRVAATNGLTLEVDRAHHH